MRQVDTLGEPDQMSSDADGGQRRRPSNFEVPLMTLHVKDLENIAGLSLVR
jgi:hypothetical protein